MAEALIWAVIENLASMALHQIGEEVSLVKDNAVALKTSLETIQAVLEDAERKQLTDSSLKIWLNNLKHVSHDMDHVLDEWNTAVLGFRVAEKEAETKKKKEVRFALPFSCFKSKAVVKKLTVRHDIGHKIKELNKKIDEIVREKDKFNPNNAVTVDRPVSHRTQTISFVEETDTYGRDGDKEVLVRRLVSGDTSGIEIVPVVGMGGLGKTTLAQLAFNNKTVKARFDNRIWVCVSDPFDIIKVAKAIVEAVEGTAPVINELETLLQRVRRCVEGKRFLLVLDDVWTRDGNKWEQLKQPLGFGAHGSRILVTTRK